MTVKSLLLCTFFIAYSHEFHMEYLEKGVNSKFVLQHLQKQIITLTKNFTWDEPHLKLNLSLAGQEVGFDNFQVRQALLTPDLNLTLKLYWANAVLSGSYHTNGSYYKILPIRGEGNFLMDLKRFELFVDTKIHPSNGTLQLPHFDMDYDFGDMTVSIGGVTGQADLAEVIRRVVKDLVPNVIAKRKNKIISSLNHFVTTSGNEMLKTFTLRKIIELIKGFYY